MSEPETLSPEELEKEQKRKVREANQKKRRERQGKEQQVLNALTDRVTTGVPKNIWTGKVVMLREAGDEHDIKEDEVIVRYIVPKQPEENAGLEVDKAALTIVGGARKRNTPLLGHQIKGGDIVIVGVNTRTQCFLYSGKELTALTNKVAADYVRKWEMAHSIDRRDQISEEEFLLSFPRFEAQSAYTMVKQSTRPGERRYLLLFRQGLDRTQWLVGQGGHMPYPFLTYTPIHDGLTYDNALLLLYHYQRKELHDWVQLLASRGVVVEESQAPAPRPKKPRKGKDGTKNPKSSGKKEEKPGAKQDDPNKDS